MNENISKTIQAFDPSNINLEEYKRLFTEGERLEEIDQLIRKADRVRRAIYFATSSNVAENVDYTISKLLDIVELYRNQIRKSNETSSY